MPAPGYKSYFIIGVQDTDWDTPVLTAAMEPIIYEFISETLRSASTPVVPERLSGNPSPKKQMNSFITAGGDIVMHLHTDNIFELLAQIMQATSSETASTDFTPQEVYADAAFASPFSLDTQPNATSPVSAPGRLHFTLGQASAGQFTIAGVDQHEARISDGVRIDVGTTGATTKYFEIVDVNGISFTGFGDAQTVQINADRNLYTHVIQLGDDVLNGLTIEMVKAGIPSVYIGSLVSAATLTLGDTLTLTMSLLAKRGWNRYKVPTGGPVPLSSNSPTSVSGYARINEEVFPGWGLALYLDSSASAIGIETASLSINNNLAFPRRFRNVRTEPKPVRQGPRETALVVTVDYDTTNPDYDLAMYNNEVMDAKLVAYRLPHGGPEYSIEIFMARCQITAFPDPEVSDFSELTQELALNPIRSAGASSSDEILITLLNHEAGDTG